MRKRIAACLIAAMMAGCATPKYGEEKQLTLRNGTHPVWAVAPAVNLSGESSVDPILQADLVFHQLQKVNNLTVIPVNRVVQVYAALHITKVESEEQAAIVCDQLGCDGLVIPTLTIYDPYNPPKMGVALQLLGSQSGRALVNNVDARELTRMATPGPNEVLSPHPNFIQVVGMYDAADGSTHAAVLRYAKGRMDPTSPMGTSEFFICMDRYSEFVYHTLIAQMISRLPGQPPEPAEPVETSRSLPNGLTAQAN